MANIILPEGYTMKPEIKARLEELAEFHNMDDAEIQAFVNIHIELMQEYNNAMCAAMIQLANANRTDKKQPKYEKHHHTEVDMSQLSKRSSKGKGYLKPLRKQ